MVFAEDSATLRDMLPETDGPRRLELLEKIYNESLATDDLDEQIRCLYDLLGEARRQKNEREECYALLKRTVLFYNNNLSDSIYLHVPEDR